MPTTAPRCYTAFQTSWLPVACHIAGGLRYSQSIEIFVERQIPLGFAGSLDSAFPIPIADRSQYGHLEGD